MRVKRGKKTVKTFFIAMFWVFAICYNVNSITAQSTDCAGPNGATGICSNETLNLNSSGPGMGDFNSPNNGQGCLNTGEHESAWLLIQIDSGNTLGFLIDPRGADDYDFAVYGPNRTCDNLGDPIRCSYALGNGNTGMNSTANDLSEGAGGNGFVRWLNVNPGETYYILVDNFSENNGGFAISWTGDAVLDCDVTLPCPVIDLGSDTVLCDGNSIEIGVAVGPNESYLWNTGATTNNIMIADSGWYWIEATKNGCSETDSIYVSKSITPIVDLGNDTTLCEDETILLNANVPNALTYLWQDGSTLPLLLVSTPGNYSVRVSNDLCSSVDDINIAYDQKIAFSLEEDTVVCDNTTFVIDATTTGATGYSWQDGNSTPMYNATNPGIYWVKVSNTACSSLDSLVLDFQQSPSYDLGQDESYCEDDTITLNAFASGATSYLWQDGSSQSTFTTNETGLYIVEVTNDECSTIDSVDLTFLEYPEVNLPNDTTLCDNDSLVLNAFSPIAGDYLWQDGSMADNYVVSTAGEYFVQVSNDFCSTADSIAVAYNSSPVFDLGQDTIICKGSEYVLVVSNQATDVVITWLDNSNDSNFVVTEQGEYYVSAVNQCGISYDTVYVEYGSCNCNFYIANGFTPNNDGINDGFDPIVDCDSLTDYNLEIFDRWGEMVYTTKDSEASWMEPNVNLDLPMDVYLWAIEYKWTWRGKEMSNKESGYVTILR